MPKFEKKIFYNVVITPTITGGFKVMVGCAELFYTDHSALLADLRDYLEDPGKAEEEYRVAMDGEPLGMDPRGEERTVATCDCGTPGCLGARTENRPDIGPIEAHGPVYPVARCHCGADLDAMGRRIPRGGDRTPRPFRDRGEFGPYESPHGPNHKPEGGKNAR